MIREICFELKWIKEIQKKNDRLNPVFIENAIYAFELLSELVKLKIDFVFKGGTSLLLHFPEPRRLSIDIDIVGEFDLDILDKIIQNNPRFKSYKPAKRYHTKDMIRNFEFYYDTVIENVEEQFVLLDIIFAKPCHPVIETKEIKSPLFESDETMNVQVPSIESLMGDKLTAFAPKTIGIPLIADSFRPVNIIKQLFDISVLFDATSNLKTVYESYINNHKQNCEIRKQDFGIIETLNDTIDTCLLLSSFGLNKTRDRKLQLLELGCDLLNQFLISDIFSAQLSKKHAAKVALISAILKKERFDFELSNFRFSKSKLKQLKDAKLSSIYTSLEKLKEIDSEAYYYWHLVSQIEEGKL